MKIKTCMDTQANYVCTLTVGVILLSLSTNSELTIYLKTDLLFVLRFSGV